MAINYFESEVRNSLEQLKNDYPTFTYRRLYDTQSFHKIHKKLFALKQPGDFYAVCNGKFYLMECKSYKGSKTSYPLAYIQPHQIEDLTEFSRCGGRSYFMICNRNDRRNIITYVVDINDFNRMISGIEDLGKKSIKWCELKRYSMLPKRLKGGLWDLKSLFNLI